jgi:small subunit ribosomal protein S20
MSARRRTSKCRRWPVAATAAAERRCYAPGAERVENLRYRSTIKTLTKRLATAVEGGDATTAETEHRTLVKWIDRAVARGALHRNTAARKKSQAARLFSRS